MSIPVSSTMFGSIVTRIAEGACHNSLRNQLFTDLLLVALEPHGVAVETSMSKLARRVLADVKADATSGGLNLDSLPAECTFRKDFRGFWCYMAKGVKDLGYGLTPREAFDHRWEYESQVLAHLAEHSADCAVKTTD